MTPEKDILIVDEDIPDLELLAGLLEKEGYQVRPASKPQAALETALAKPPSLILLKIHSLVSVDFEICRSLKQDERTKHVPVILISEIQDTEAKTQGFKAGGVDFIFKPFDEQEVLARVRTYLQLHQLQNNLEQMVEERLAEIGKRASRFSYLIENANEAVLVTQDEAVKYCNPKISELTGYSPEEMRSLSFDKFIHPEDLEMVLGEYRARLSGEKPKNSYSLRMINRDGHVKYAFIKSALIEWEGKPAALAMITDITEQKQMEARAISSEKRFQNLMEQSPLDTVIMTPEGRIREVNQAWLRNWDVQADEANKIIAAYNMRTDSQIADLGFAPLVERAFAGEEVVLPPIHYIPKRLLDEIGLEDMEARERWIQTHMYSIKDTNGSVDSVVAVNMDITDLKSAEAKAFSTETQFQDLVNQSPMPVEILSLDGKIIRTNPAWKRLWGVDGAGAAEVMEKYNMRTDPQLKKLGIDHLVERAFCGEHIILPPIIYDAHETTADFDIEKLKGLKSPWIQCHLSPIKDQNGEIFSIVNTYVDITDLKNSEEELSNALKEIEELKDRLEIESAYLREEIKLDHNFESIIGNSAALKYTLNRVEQVAPTDSPVLIMGETGTGKELIARALHELSQRSKRALVKVNCAALPADLIESELFGREKGAFTGAATAQAGRFEVADGSTLFLDEIGELPVELQAKLLRVLDSGEFERLGSTRTRHSNARIIAATNRELEEEVRENRFREDLWFRLKVFPITVPPLRERLDDLPLLARFFIDLYSKQMGKPSGDITIRSMNMMQQYHWPGNVRELKHAIEGACITVRGRNLQIDLPKVKDQLSTEFQTLEDMERDYIVRVLEARNWKIGGANSAASTLGMHVNTLRGRMKKLGIKKN